MSSRFTRLRTGYALFFAAKNVVRRSHHVAGFCGRGGYNENRWDIRVLVSIVSSSSQVAIYRYFLTPYART